MAALIEDVVSLEKEADAIVAQARAEAKALEKIAVAEAEAYRRKLADETNRKISAFQRETEAKYEHSVAETGKDLNQALNAIDEIPGHTLKEQIDKIVAKLGEQ